jgi:hypothetical protein
MTIALGILAQDGILLAADSEETHSAEVKVDQRKLNLAIHWAQDGTRSALVTGAGDGHLIDVFSQQLQDRVFKDVRLKTDPIVVLDECLAKFYAKHVLPFQHYQPMERPDFDLIVALTADDGVPHLYKSRLNTFLRCGPSTNGFAAVGIGALQATVLMKRVLGVGWRPKLNDAAIVAGYVLHVVKETVPGCGKRSDIRALHGHGFSTLIPPVTQELEEAVTRYSGQFEGAMFLSVTGSRPSKMVATTDELRKLFAELREKIRLGPP